MSLLLDALSRASQDKAALALSPTAPPAAVPLETQDTSAQGSTPQASANLTELTLEDTASSDWPSLVESSLSSPDIEPHQQPEADQEALSLTPHPAAPHEPEPDPINLSDLIDLPETVTPITPTMPLQTPLHREAQALPSPSVVADSPAMSTPMPPMQQIPTDGARVAQAIS